MQGEDAPRAPLRESLGLLVTALCAVLLVFTISRTIDLGREAALDRTTLDRERVGVAETAHILAAMRAIERFRDAIVAAPDRVPLTRAAADSELRALEQDFQRGPAAKFDLGTQVLGAVASWHNVRGTSAGPQAFRRFDPLMGDLKDLLTAMEDASNLSYDPSTAAQNLADAYVAETPYAIEAASRAAGLALVAADAHGMTLAQRIDLAGNNEELKRRFDLSTDELPSVASNLDASMPSRTAEWNALPPLASQLSSAGDALRTLIAQRILLQDAPAVSRSAIEAAESRALRNALAMHAATESALQADLGRRLDLLTLRRVYFYLSLAIGLAMAVGVMMTIGQLVARRDRAALQSARRESERLSAELARQEAENALRRTEAQFRAVFDGAALGIAVIDSSGSLVQANSVYRAMFGDSIASSLEGHESELAQLFDGERDTFEFEGHLASPSGHEVWTDATISVVNDEAGDPLFAVCMFRDKTALKQHERRMQHEKTHDRLTGLPNRQFFDECVRHRLEESKTLLDSFFAIFVIDVEHFKDVNESLGHAAGDLVLTQFSSRLRACVDTRDVVARLGNDEYAVMIQSLGDILHVESIARRIVNNLCKPVMIGGRPVFLGAHVGIALASTNYERAEDLMRDAEIALQHTRAGGGGQRYSVFDSKMRAMAQKRLQLTSDLRLALERFELRLLYQPIVSMNDGRLVGCEALVRWDHPRDGMLMPTEFVPLAERTGLARHLGRFVLDTAASQLGAWQRNRGGKLHFRMHVNLSAPEILDPDFERTLVQIVDEHDIRPADLALEITEGVVLDASARTSAVLDRARERGFHICIDDFGTGYSSMRYLQQFKVDAIKIDRSFVAGVDGELASEPIVRTLMSLAEAYDVRVVAEGVETQRQRDVLRNAGCRFGQGYFFARPLSAAQMEEMYSDVLGEVQRSASA
jgi:diguanylate cyclase (GGDEF)-like protein/PAS domain S-box-containing protein